MENLQKSRKEFGMEVAFRKASAAVRGSWNRPGENSSSGGGGEPRG